MSPRPGTSSPGPPPKRARMAAATALELDVIAAPLPGATMPRPAQGDHVTLYNLREASPWLRLHASTLATWIKSGEIPARYVTRLGGGSGRAGRLVMSGDQIVGLLLYWRERTAAAATPPPPTRRRKRVAA